MIVKLNRLVKCKSELTILRKKCLFGRSKPLWAGLIGTTNLDRWELWGGHPSLLRVLIQYLWPKVSLLFWTMAWMWLPVYLPDSYQSHDFTFFEICWLFPLYYLAGSCYYFDSILFLNLLCCYLIILAINIDFYWLIIRILIFSEECGVWDLMCCFLILLRLKAGRKLSSYQRIRFIII